ncbi:hypothetical protein P167DRAFT_535761 [Morchella conica CCBAS932]|uniref:Secreted protein n=1 Tax=Morchella conica CCBAS932 TaxID=1392247 RepID=A0A3N4KQ89_9PEZI|nr:hypothetical protein P167DRAFT_535761 [Morchella conica CCBAS932]
MCLGIWSMLDLYLFLFFFFLLSSPPCIDIDRVLYIGCGKSVEGGAEQQEALSSSEPGVFPHTQPP